MATIRDFFMSLVIPDRTRPVCARSL
jgi:hypothetical protein